MFIAVLSDKPELRENFCKLIGKEISKDDIGIYSADVSGRKVWLIDPLHYPEKIQPLLYSISMADAVVVLVDTISPKIGEIIVAVNSLRVERGVIVSTAALPVAGTVLEKFDKVADNAAAKDKLLAMERSASGENVVGLVHKTANVKSLGNVVYGVLKSGKLKKNDKLFLLPDRKDVELRSLHVDGAEVDESAAYFEAAYKGELAEHGVLASLRHEFQVENIVNGRFTRCPFYKDEIHGKIYAYSNMQFIEGHLNENDLTLSTPLAFEKGEAILVVDASNQKLRIAGVFQSKW